MKEVFGPHEKEEAYGGKEVWEQRWKWSNIALWTTALKVPKGELTRAMTILDIKYFVFSKEETMLDFLHEIELERWKENAEQSERLQKLPELKRAPMASTPDMVSKIDGSKAKQ